MLYVYKQSQQPMQPWSMLRRGGPNNVAPQAKGRFLVLHNADAVYRDGAWHYVLEFDVRDSLQLSPLAQMMGGKNQGASYRDGANWRKWLGDHWQVIDEHVRWEIVHSGEADPMSAEDRISGVRELPAWHPHPQPQKRLTLFPSHGPASLPDMPPVQPMPPVQSAQPMPPMPPRRDTPSAMLPANGKPMHFPIEI